MKNLLDKISGFFLLSALLCSCVDNKYDLDNIDDSGGLSPSLVLPIGTLNTSIIDFIKGAGIEDPLIIGTDTIYVRYKDTMFLRPTLPIPGLEGGDVIYNIPGGIQFGFDGGVASINLSFFENLARTGSVINLANPMIFCTICNYVGADVNIDFNSVTSEGNGQRKQAIFSDGSTKYSIDVESAPSENKYFPKNVIFDRTNGRMPELFSIAPDRILFDISVDLEVPADGNEHFIVNGKYVDVAYELRLPLTFGPGTQLIYSDTLDFDLSGEGFINNIDGLTLWIDYTNSLRTTVDLDVLFLDENRIEIDGIKEKHFPMNAASASDRATGSFTLSFDSDEFDNAQKARYAILRSTLKTDNQNNESVNIHPADYINFKLSAYSKINI
jgi:hypothetical protein